MIASLTGTIAHLGATTAIIEVGGVGYQVHLTPTHALDLRHGETTRIVTAMVVREDALTLYGFRTQDEREVFDQLVAISGVGPKSALGVLSQLDPDALAVAVDTDDEAAFKRVPGVGPKTAKLIILQLKGKLRAAGAVRGEIGALTTRSSSTTDDVIEAIVALGTPQKQAAAAVELAYERLDTETPDVPTLLREALRELGGQR